MKKRWGLSVVVAAYRTAGINQIDEFRQGGVVVYANPRPFKTVVETVPFAAQRGHGAPKIEFFQDSHNIFIVTTGRIGKIARRIAYVSRHRFLRTEDLPDQFLTA